MVQNSRTRFEEDGGRSSRLAGARRWGALIGGSALAIYGISRKSPLGLALAAGGGTIAFFGSRQRGNARVASPWTSNLINCTPEEAYRFWRDFENLPLFMKRLEEVTVLDDRRSRWVAVGPMGKQIRWEAEITSERENEYIEWQSLPGSDLRVDGRVEFQQAPAGRGTLINARLQFGALPGMSSAAAHFLKKGAKFAVRQDLRRLEALLETGEIPTTEGQSHGPRDFVTAVVRVADPTQPIRPQSNVRDMLVAKRGIA